MKLCNLAQPQMSYVDGVNKRRQQWTPPLPSVTSLFPRTPATREPETPPIGDSTTTLNPLLEGPRSILPLYAGTGFQSD
jgi:hypothetical protein